MLGEGESESKRKERKKPRLINLIGRCFCMYVCNARKGTMMIKGESVQQSGVGVGGGGGRVQDTLQQDFVFFFLFSCSIYFSPLFDVAWFGSSVVLVVCGGGGVELNFGDLSKQIRYGHRYDTHTHV